jgi:hypothetical protein
MAGWGIAEWFGQDVLTMSEEERRDAADRALAAQSHGMKNAPQPLCPFLSSIKPGSPCTKKGGICSIRQYAATTPATPVDAQPTTLCPNRFLEFRNEETVFGHISRELFGSSVGSKVIKEIPFLQKEMLDGTDRGAKAGRIDWIIVPDADGVWEKVDMPWIAIETQGVYFSGASMWPDIADYRDNPHEVRYPVGTRRPDYRSSGAKRLSPQLAAKAPVMNRWGRKVVVVVDEAFFAEMGALTETTDFDNSEVVWVIVRYVENMALQVTSTKFAELAPSLAALQAAKPVFKGVFEADLRNALRSKKAGKVFPV